MNGQSSMPTTASMPATAAAQAQGFTPPVLPNSNARVAVPSFFQRNGKYLITLFIIGAFIALVVVYRKKMKAKKMLSHSRGRSSRQSMPMPMRGHHHHPHDNRAAQRPQQQGRQMRSSVPSPNPLPPKQQESGDDNMTPLR